MEIKKFENENIEIRPYFNKKYLLVGAALCGGRAFALLKDFYKRLLCYEMNIDEEKVYSLMDKMLNKTQNTDLIVDTRFSGTRKNNELKGSIKNITTENFTPENLTVGLVNGMVEELYNMYLEMGINKNGVVGSGNALRKNPALVRCAEERFNAKIKIPLHTEEAAYGAALFSAVSAGVFNNIDEAQSLIKY